jgi:hypothetical protein
LAYFTHQSPYGFKYRIALPLTNIRRINNMSAKFEQLLDHLVNENMDQANELFHEIVVEMSRGIYEQLIAEEEDEEMDEAKSEDDEEMDESKEEDEEEMDESMETEESYSMEGDDEEGEHGFAKGDAADEFGASVTGDDEEGEMDHEKSEDDAIFDFKAAFEKLEAAFADLEAAQGGEEADMGMGPDMGDEDEDEGMMMGKPAFEGRRMTREYVEKVGNDWDKSGSQKSQGQIVGANTGESMPHAENARSVVSSGKGKPATGATAENILRGGDEGGTPTGTSPAGKAGGFLSNAKDMNTGNGNVPGGKMGVKNLSKVAGGHGAEKKGSGPGPVGAGTGDKAGQTSDANGTKKQFLPPHTRP